MKNKRGAEVGTVVVFLVVALALAVILIWGFSTNWKPFRERFGGGPNVDTISQTCNTACVTQGTYDFCSKKRELRAEDETLKDVTCFWLSEKKTEYGIESCAEITCDVVFNMENCASGKTLQTFDENTKTLKRTICPAS